MYPSYSVAIRPLGKAGTIYEDLIHSLCSQSVPPEKIVVYIAEGYVIPKQVENEIYVSCKKGMMSQRALPYHEIDSEWILFCDDDILLEKNAVKTLFDAVLDNNAECIAPNVFPNHQMPFKEKMLAAVFQGTWPSRYSKYAFRIRRSAHYSYRVKPPEVMVTQSFAGPCFLMKKKVFLEMDYSSECWIDQFPYALGDDQLIAYKLFVNGYTSLIHYNAGIIHRDAQTAHSDSKRERYFNVRVLQYIIWHRTFFETRLSGVGRLVSVLCFYAQFICNLMVSAIPSLIRGDKSKTDASIRALRCGRQYVQSADYQRIPKFRLNRTGK